MRTKQQALELIDHLYSRAKRQEGIAKVTTLIVAKSICDEAGLISLSCDLIGQIGLEKERMNEEIRRENRKRKKEGLSPEPLLPVFTFAGADLDDKIRRK